MRAEAQVVGESHLEPPLEIVGGQRRKEAELGLVLERPPEALEPGSGEDAVLGAASVLGAEASGGLLEHAADELGTLIGDQVPGASEEPDRGLEEPGHGGGARLSLVELERERKAGEGVEDGGEVEGSAEEGRDLGDAIIQTWWTKRATTGRVV
jgi:hypothetical protein